MDQTNFEKICSKIKDHIGVECEITTEIQRDSTIRIPSTKLPVVIDILKDNFGYYHLSAITAQQRKDQRDEIEVLYHFWKGSGLSLMTILPAEAPQLPSIVSMIPGADFYEREAAEMFGIEFTGRTETPPLLLPEDWAQGPPLINNEEQDE